MPLKGSGMQWKVSNDQIREAAHVEIDCPYGSTLVAIKGVSTQYKYFLTCHGMLKFTRFRSEYY